MEIGGPTRESAKDKRTGHSEMGRKPKSSGSPPARMNASQTGIIKLLRLSYDREPKGTLSPLAHQRVFATIEQQHIKTIPITSENHLPGERTN